MALQVKTLGGAAAMYEQLAKAGTGGGDFKAPLRASAKMISANNIRRFDKQIDAEGKKWKQLTKPYEKRKRKKHKGKKSAIGVDTSIMRTSITSNSNALSVFNLSNHLVQFGTKVAYAEHFQKLRPFIGISPDDIEEMGDIFSIWMEREIFKANKRSKK